MTGASRCAMALGIAMVLAGCSGEATTRQPLGTASAVAESAAAATSSAAPTDTGSPAWTVTPDPGHASEVSDDDVALMEDFVAFMVEPTPRRAQRLPFVSDGVRLGLGDEMSTTVAVDGLADEKSWVVDRETFRAHTGPFSPIRIIREHIAAAVDPPLRMSNDLQVSVGEHAHCASLPVPPPASVASLRRVSVQPAHGSIGSCVFWFSVDLYLDTSGDIQAVTFDLYEP
ncbi:hypothetical protein [Phytoactinopolyspora halotolerans]|uniref:Lipoprotein n=1 Tax=Phytoactinopolyspora halotolerans TaxID=1981512 RepID=A0A6L9SE19_9ACTN|nr:hypothetical protein [Phytoactinopolyspora halotolerans]NEE03403.1 hypothetical protein [Phytoactinopolyspora halotolerans]